MGHWRVKRLTAAARRWAVRGLYRTGLFEVLRRRALRGNRGLPILTYHSVGGSRFMNPALSVSAENFEAQVRYLTRHYRVLALDSAVGLIERGEPFPGDAVVVTFDDGYRDNYEKALPVLSAYGCPATIFVTTEPVDARRSLWPNTLYFWLMATSAAELRVQGARQTDGGAGADGPAVFPLGSRRERLTAFRVVESHARALDPAGREALLRDVARGLGLPPDADPFEEVAMLTWDELREMSAAGVAIGSHTVTHPVLSALGEADAWRELVESKAMLERRLGRPVTLLAYPYGERRDYNAAIQLMARNAGYRAACSTVSGLNLPAADPFALRRLHVADHPAPIFAERLLRAVRSAIQD